MKEKLFLLNPNFIDEKVDKTGTLYYCPDCAMIEGFLAYYPEVRNHIEIIYVDFKTPRQLIVNLIGEENQGCPVLIIPEQADSGLETSYFKNFGDVKFVNTKGLIEKYLSDKLGVGLPHP